MTKCQCYSSQVFHFAFNLDLLLVPCEDSLLGFLPTKSREMRTLVAFVIFFVRLNVLQHHIPNQTIKQDPKRKQGINGTLVLGAYAVCGFEVVSMLRRMSGACKLCKDARFHPR